MASQSAKRPMFFSDSPGINENYYPIDALNEGQFTFFNGALNPFNVESPIIGFAEAL